MYQVSLALKQVKCFVAALVLGSTALIVIALSATSLVKEVHTACHTDQLFKNVSVALMIQEQINRGFKDRLNALEEAIHFIKTNTLVELL